MQESWLLRLIKGGGVEFELICLYDLEFLGLPSIERIRCLNEHLRLVRDNVNWAAHLTEHLTLLVEGDELPLELKFEISFSLVDTHRRIRFMLLTVQVVDVLLKFGFVDRHETLVHLPSEWNKFLAENACAGCPATFDAYREQLLSLSIDLLLHLRSLLWLLLAEDRSVGLKFKQE